MALQKNDRLEIPACFIMLCLLVYIITSAPIETFAQMNDKHGLLWAEIWANTSYCKTNLGEKSDDYKEEDFFPTILSINTGLRLSFTHCLFFDPYFNLDLNEDFGNNLWNKVYWNNNTVIGPGARLRYEYESKDEKKGVFALNSFFLGIFSEYLFMFDSLNGSNDSIPDSTNSENLRIGMESWTSIETKEYNAISFWGEAWGEFSFNSTNFYSKGTDDFYSLSIQPKAGIQYKYGKFSLQTYYKLNLSADFGDRSWNKEPWFNNVQYGPGIGLLFEKFKINEDMSLLIYAEALHIAYLPRVDKSNCSNISSEDYRINIELWVPFGAITKSMFAH